MLQITLHSLTNANPAGRQLATRAVSLLQQIVNDPRFLPQVAQARYTYTACMTDSGKDVLSTDNETIAQIIAGGKEIMRSPDGVIDLTVLLRHFFFHPGTMGSVVPPNHTISTNKRFFRRWVRYGDVVSLAAHWMHEWMHVAGFYHATDSGDPNDVPYTVGDIAARVGQSIAAASGMKSLGEDALGEDYLNAAREHRCLTVPGGPPADLFAGSDRPDDADDSEDADND